MFVFERDFFSGHAPHPTPPAWGGGKNVRNVFAGGSEVFILVGGGGGGGRSCNFEVKVKTA